ncbi:hypothetical protein DL96DRAFT_375851 [Flagelloscypha sp. PMI_526]|nr:hypothetical protein DL96DRAFT_375851 [Flagelloscypha sp. PMI_526]
MLLSPTGYPFYLLSSTRRNFDDIFARLFSKLRPRGADLTGKTAIVTGANVGIGLEAARAFASMGGTIIMACRSESRGKTAREEILATSKGKISPNQLQVELLDLGDLDSVQSFIARWGDKPLDILINNAGVTLGKYSKNPQGFELSYVTNILSHYFLTLSLLPFMRPNARIVNVTSVGSYSYKSQFNVSDLDHSKHIETKFNIRVGGDLPSDLSFQLYQRQKLLQVYFTREMQKRLEESDKYAKMGISVHCYHPGLVKSNIWTRDDGLKFSWAKTLLRIVNALGSLFFFLIFSSLTKFICIFIVSTEQGAATAVYLATNKDFVPRYSGLYWYRMSLRGANRLVEDEKTRSLVWDQMAVESKLREDLKL